MNNAPLFNIPKEVSRVTDTLEKAGYEAHLIGGCVRDLYLGKLPKDWDVTTNATPDEIIALFDNTFYENEYGTVGVVAEGEVDPTLKVVEVTPYRIETTYSDKRHPDKVHFSKNLEDDLKRRDFTVNAIALRRRADGQFEAVDLYEGKKDIQKGIIRTVGAASLRFEEDGLRILRGIRLSAELNFSIDPETKKAMSQQASLLEHISAERVKDEFVKILMSDLPVAGIELMRQLGILNYILPELLKGIDCGQNQAHSYDVYEHLMRTLEHAAKKKFPLEVRLAALLHDIGKPDTRRFSDEKKDYTFYGHDVVSERIAKKLLERLKFSNKIIETVTKLVRWHMFFSDTETITLSAVRRMIRNVGQERIWDLMNVRICDRIGTGRPKESPYRLRKYRSMIDEALRDPVSVSQLKIGGQDLLDEIKMPPGPAMGYILHILLDEVLDDPAKNTRKYLLERASALAALPPEELKQIGEKAKENKDKLEMEEVKKIRDKHHVE